MAEFGITATTNAGYDLLGKSNVLMQKVTLSEAGTVSSLSVYARSGGSSSQTFRLALYNDDGANLLGTLVACSVEHTITTGETTYAWHECTITGGASCSAGDYWIMVWPGDTSEGIRFNATNMSSGSGAWKDGVTYSATGNPPSPLTGDASWASTHSLKGTYTASGVPKHSDLYYARRAS